MPRTLNIQATKSYRAAINSFHHKVENHQKSKSSDICESKKSDQRAMLSYLIRKYKRLNSKNSSDTMDVVQKIRYLMTYGSLFSLFSSSSNDHLLIEAENIIKSTDILQLQPIRNCKRCRGLGLRQFRHYKEGRCFICGTLPW